MDTCMINNTIKRVIKIKCSKNIFKHLNTDGYKFIIPVDKELDVSDKPNFFCSRAHKYYAFPTSEEFIYAISYNEEFYDKNINDLLSEHGIFSWFPLFLYDTESNFSAGEIFREYQKFNHYNQNYYATSYHDFLWDSFKMNQNMLKLNFNQISKKINFYKKIYKKHLSINKICNDNKLLEKPLTQSNHSVLSDSLLIHPLFILLSDTFSNKSYFKTNLKTNFLKKIIFTYEYVLKKIEVKENIKFDNYNLFECYLINTTKFKNLSSIIAIQDFYYIIDLFIYKADKNFNYSEKIIDHKNSHTWPKLLYQDAFSHYHYKDLPTNIFDLDLGHYSKTNKINLEYMINNIIQDDSMIYLNKILSNDNYKSYYNYIQNIIDNKEIDTIIKDNILIKVKKRL